MLRIRIVAVGRVKESYYSAAISEYIKRLRAFCTLEIMEISEVRVSDGCSAHEIERALYEESVKIGEAVPKGAKTVAMCVEGDTISSEGLCELMAGSACSGDSRLCFIIGGSHGLHGTVKRGASRQLSMSAMTFPHGLARVILLEQIYRGFMISSGGKYHK